MTARKLHPRLRNKTLKNFLKKETTPERLQLREGRTGDVGPGADAEHA